MGQKNVVQVIKFVARGTIEEKMNELQEKKRHLIEEIIDSEEKGRHSYRRGYSGNIDDLTNDLLSD